MRAAFNVPLRDAKDRAVLVGAFASHAEHLLTTDESGVGFWHPSTLLTLFFQAQLDVYRDVSIDLDRVEPASLVP